MAPPTKRTVLSFDIRPNEQHELKAEIEAALPLQKLARKRRTKSKALIAQPEQSEHPPHDVNWQCACQKCVQSKLRAETFADPAQHRSTSRPRRTIGGTVKGELTTAKDYLKSMPRRQLDRLRSRKTKHEVSPAGIDLLKSPIDQVGDVGSFTYQTPGYAELSGSEPVVEIDDGEEQAKCVAGTRHSLPPAYGDERKLQDLSPVSSMRPEEARISLRLQSRSCKCDNCHKSIAGDDTYGFCSQCPPESRVLCTACVDQGGCSRHRIEQVRMQLPPSPRGSPAPSYNERHKAKGNDEVEYRTGTTAPLQAMTLEEFAVQVESQKAHGCTKLGDDKNVQPAVAPPADALYTSSSTLVASSKQRALDNEFTELLMREHVGPHATAASLLAREATLREQQAVLREQQIANRELYIREQEISLRERINQSQDRDAIVIQGLQQWFTELARSVQIGAQFQASKAGDTGMNTPIPPVSRATSTSSNTSDISLRNDEVQHNPSQVVSQAMADAETTFNGAEPDNSHIRSHTQKRKKAETGDGAKTTTPVAHSTGMNQQSIRKYAEEGDNEDDEDDNEDPLPFKKQKQTPPESLSCPRLFACPYCKNDRDRYSPKNRNQSEKQYRGCVGRDLPDIPRLKQHLRRVHWRPINHCPRCWNDCKCAAGLAEHHEQDERCVKKACPFPERMDKQQQDKIHVKRPRVDQVQQWYEIYSVLFPDGPLPDSPYADEEDSISPIVPATPAAVSHDEAAQRLGKLFNDRLDKYNDQLDPQALELVRRLHNESVVELFAGLSLTPSPSPKTHVPTTPSIVVSPVEPASDKQMRFDSQGSATIANEYPRGVFEHAIGHPRMLTQAVPRMGDPAKLELGPALPGQVPRHTSRAKLQKVDNVSDQTMTTLLPSPIMESSISNNIENAPLESVPRFGSDHGSENIGFAAQQVEPSISNSAVVEFPTVPQYLMEDHGYDDESHSYESGDDQFAMGSTRKVATRVRRKFHLNTLQVPESPRPQREFKLSLETLKDLQPEYINTTEQLQHRKSIASNLDSGYGSGNSERPDLRVPPFDVNQEDEEMPDIECYPSSGHVTFMEEFEILGLTTQSNMNPWHTEEDIGWAK